MKYLLKKINKNKYTPKRFFGVVIVFITVAGASFTYSQTAQASLFSFFADLISAVKVSADTRSLSSGSSTNDQQYSPQNTSQSMPILEAASNPNPNPNNCSDISPVNGTILDPGIASSLASSCGTNSTQISTYVVVPGDTISTVAHMFNVSTNTVLWANNLTGKSVLQPGQTLVILPISGINYVVKSGDSLQSISKKYGGDHASDILSDILDYNDMTINSKLTIGQKIIIPSAEISASDIAPIKVVTGSKAIYGTDPLLDNIKNWPAYPSCNSATAGCYYLRPIQGGHISQKLHGHNAVDLAAPVGTPIVASAEGTVIISRINGAWNGGYGNYVVISHSNGSQTLYAHMSAKSAGLVKVGQRVNQGKLVGYIGMTGHTTGPHLHFEIRGAQDLFWNPNL